MATSNANWNYYVPLHESWRCALAQDTGAIFPHRPPFGASCHWPGARGDVLLWHRQPPPDGERHVLRLWYVHPPAFHPLQPANLRQYSLSWAEPYQYEACATSAMQSHSEPVPADVEAAPPIDRVSASSPDTRPKTTPAKVFLSHA